MNTIEFIIIFLLIANSYILVRNEFVYRFAKRITKMSYDYNLRHLLTDNDDAFDWDEAVIYFAVTDRFFDKKEEKETSNE